MTFSVYETNCKILVKSFNSTLCDCLVARPWASCQKSLVSPARRENFHFYLQSKTISLIKEEYLTKNATCLVTWNRMSTVNSFYGTAEKKAKIGNSSPNCSSTRKSQVLRMACQLFLLANAKPYFIQSLVESVFQSSFVSMVYRSKSCPTQECLGSFVWWADWSFSSARRPGKWTTYVDPWEYGPWWSVNKNYTRLALWIQFELALVRSKNILELLQENCIYLFYHRK